jgi:hypothetical protein
VSCDLTSIKVCAFCLVNFIFLFCLDSEKEMVLKIKSIEIKMVQEIKIISNGTAVRFNVLIEAEYKDKNMLKDVIKVVTIAILVLFISIFILVYILKLINKLWKTKSYKMKNIGNNQSEYDRRGSFSRMIRLKFLKEKDLVDKIKQFKKTTSI